MNSHELTGERGIYGIKRKLVKINNYTEAKYEVRRRGISLDKFVIETANQLGFDYVLPKRDHKD